MDVDKFANTLLSPTLPEGTDVKKGPPIMWGKSRFIKGALKGKNKNDEEKLRTQRDVTIPREFNF